MPETKSEQHEIPFINAPPPDWVLYPSLFALGIVFIFYLLHNPQPKIGRARLLTSAELNKSQQKATKKLKDGDGITLWINSPKRYKKVGKRVIFIPDKKTILLPDANTHLAAISTTGAGKTRFILNRIAMSAGYQDYPIIAIDFKGDEERWKGDPGVTEDTIAPFSEVAGFCLSRGYEIFTVDPFGKDSYGINVIKEARTPDDVATFKKVAAALSANSKALGEKRDIWDQSAELLLQAAMMMVRGFDEEYQDFATVQKVLARIHACPEAIRSAKINQYQQAAYDQYIGSLNAPETSASIIFTLMRIVAQFMTPEITHSFCRDTTIPILLKHKQAVVFRIHPEHQETMVPLVAAAVQLMMSRNLYAGLPIGGLFLWDEAPQMRLPSAAKDMAVARSKNWVYALGIQGKGIMELEHGKEQTKAIFENVNTTWTGKLASTEDQKKASERYGKEDVKAKSINSKGGNNTSQTQRDLISPQEFKGFRPGEGVIESPGFSAIISDGKKKREQVAIPYLTRITLSRREKRLMAQAKTRWLRYRKEVAKRIKYNPLTEEELQARQDYVLKMLPDPSESKNNQQINPAQLWESIDAIQQESRF
jgi:hypothetical protein